MKYGKEALIKIEHYDVFTFPKVVDYLFSLIRRLSNKWAN